MYTFSRIRTRVLSCCIIITTTPPAAVIVYSAYSIPIAFALLSTVDRRPMSISRLRACDLAYPVTYQFAFQTAIAHTRYSFFVCPVHVLLVAVSFVVHNVCVCV